MPVSYDKRGAIGVVTLSRPQALRSRPGEARFQG